MTPEIEGYVTNAEIEDFAKRVVYTAKSLKDPYLAVGALTVMNCALSIEHWRSDKRPRIALFAPNANGRGWQVSGRHEYVPQTQEIAARTEHLDGWVHVLVWGWRDTSTKGLATIGTIHDLRRHLDSLLPKPKTPKPSQGVLFDMSLGDPEA